MVIFVLFFGTFLVVAGVEHVAIVRPGFAPTGASWPAVVLSLVCCAALGMQRYVRVAEARDAPAYTKILTGGAASVGRVTSMGAPEARLGRATSIGLLVGLAISAIVGVSESQEGHPIPPLMLVWFTFVTTFMVVLFTRGVEQTRSGSRAYARMLAAELKIDLLLIGGIIRDGREDGALHRIFWIRSNFQIHDSQIESALADLMKDQGQPFVFEIG